MILDSAGICEICGRIIFFFPLITLIFAEKNQ